MRCGRRRLLCVQNQRSCWRNCGHHHRLALLFFCRAHLSVNCHSFVLEGAQLGMNECLRLNQSPSNCGYLASFGPLWMCGYCFTSKGEQSFWCLLNMQIPSFPQESVLGTKWEGELQPSSLKSTCKPKVLLGPITLL